jgi:predicted regulator of Ras-like GTPase activity (Roadblock/LC7/MglB family)
VVALGWSKDAEGLLLEAYSHSECDVELLGATTALAAGALLGRPLQQLSGATLR